LAITMSECDWKAQTGYTGPGTATYPAPPGPYTVTAPYGYGDPGHPWPTIEHTVWSKGNPTTCPTSSPGGTAPGGFAWLDGLLGPCKGSAVDDSWVHGDTGNNGCDEVMFDPYLGKVVYVPVFDCFANAPMTPPFASGTCNTGNGNNTYYHITGFAAFYLSGWKLTQDTQASVKPPHSLCATGGNDRCLSGWFVQDLIPEGEFVTPTAGNPNYGLTLVKPLG
jgi:hypothetical protein